MSSVCRRGAPPMTRSEIMRRIRSTGTKPEEAVRRAVAAFGYRYRLNRKDLPGRPDMTIAKHKLAIFVHGCFWHQHPGCKLASRPKSRLEYWEPKLSGNVARDGWARSELIRLGWRVETIWECETRVRSNLISRVAEVLSRPIASRWSDFH